MFKICMLMCLTSLKIKIKKWRFGEKKLSHFPFFFLFKKTKKKQRKKEKNKEKKKKTKKKKKKRKKENKMKVMANMEVSLRFPVGKKLVSVTFHLREGDDLTQVFFVSFSFLLH